MKTSTYAVSLCIKTRYILPEICFILNISTHTYNTRQENTVLSHKHLARVSIPGEDARTEELGWGEYNGWWRADREDGLGRA